MGFRLANAVPVHRRKIFPSGLPERARSSSRMSMDVTGAKCYCVCVCAKCYCACQSVCV